MEYLDQDVGNMGVSFSILPAANKNIAFNSSAFLVFILVAVTTKSLENKTAEDMMAIPASANQTPSIIKFYSLASIVAFFAKPNAAVPFCCRMVELTLRDGVTKYSLMGLIHFAAFIIQCGAVDDIPGAYKIGKLALT